MMMWLIGSKIKGFSFVELMIAIVVLAVGFVFIIQGFIIASDALNTSQIRFQILPFLEAKMSEIEISADEDSGTTRTSASGDLPLTSRNASWELKILGVEEPGDSEEIDLSGDLNEVSLRVSWQERNASRDILVATYLKNKKQELLVE